MTDLEQQLTDHLRRRAAAAIPRYDLEGIERGNSRVSLVDLERPVPKLHHQQRRPRLALGVAAAIVLVAVLGAIVWRDDGTVVDVSTPPPGPSDPLGDRWFAFAAGEAFHADIYLVREGETPRRVQLPGSHAYHEVCPAFAPPGTSGSGAQRLMIGRAVGGEPELVIVEVESDGSVSPSLTIPLVGLGGTPCAIWSPDGNWAALGGAGAVWVVNTNSGDVRQLPDYHPTDLEWRPGTDELAIAGEQATRADPATDAPVAIYTASTGQIRNLGEARANLLTWSPDGTTLAFTHGEDQPDSGIWLVNADGTDERQLTDQLGVVMHGTGVTWSPDGDVIAYQRQCRGCNEPHEVVLVTAVEDDADEPIGTETVIAPPRTETATGSAQWYPYNIIWSPDGTHLLYLAWGDDGAGVIAVPIDTAGPPTVITDELDIAVYDGTPWIPLQPWSSSTTTSESSATTSDALPRPG